MEVEGLTKISIRKMEIAFGDVWVRLSCRQGGGNDIKPVKSLDSPAGSINKAVDLLIGGSSL